jgi:hypothetical protein
MLKACTVVSLFIYALLNSVSYAASLLGVASITVQNSVSVHETKSLYFGTFSISNPTKSVIVNDNILTVSHRRILTVVLIVSMVCIQVHTALKLLTDISYSE